MIFKPFNDEDTCETCGKNLNQIAEGIIGCDRCAEEGAEIAAGFTCFEHFCDVFVDIFNFRFSGALVSLIWCFSRMFKIGDYAKDGLYHKKGYLDDSFFK